MRTRMLRGRRVAGYVIGWLCLSLGMMGGGLQAAEEAPSPKAVRCWLKKPTRCWPALRRHLLRSTCWGLWSPNSTSVTCKGCRSTLPNDTEIAARLAVAEQRVRLSSDTLRHLTLLMTTQELDATLYNAQLIAATGEITTDVFDV